MTPRILGKVIALLVAALLIAASVSALAAPATDKTITLSKGVEGHTYTLYQIFTGEVTTEGTTKQLTNIQWGNGVTDAYKGTQTAAEAALAINTTDDARATAKALVDGEYLQNGVTGTADADGKVEWTGLTEGYYVIVDTLTGTAPTNDDIFSEYVVQLVEDVTMDLKLDTPTIEKKVKDNDYTDNSGLNDAADYSIGDKVPYQITGSLPSNYASFDAYQYKIVDILSKGQKIDKTTLKIYVNNASGRDITSAFDVNYSTPDDGTAATTITITPKVETTLSDETTKVKDLKASVKTVNDTELAATDKIFIVYEAELTGDAVIGLDGNNNTVNLEYSNNPEDEGNGTTKTKDDETLVFTYELDVTKVDGSNSDLKLEGAQFVLKATDGDHSGKWVQIDATTGKVTGWLDSEPVAVETVPTSGNTGVLVSGSDGLFKVIGLDAGKYELKEVKAPTGYNLLTSAIAIEIKATQKNLDTYKDEDATDTPAEVLTALVIDVAGTTSSGSTETGVVEATVENNSGMTLPSTGGIGTQIFYIGGSILVLAAVILLVTKRRMNAND